ncbi:MAG: SDR family oxidoreductase [Rhodospirillales bacterium]|nr:SDR family oxidoreductase [Rhodospirillales bacterium]
MALPAHLLCFGMGYTGAALGQLLVADNWRVTGTYRRDEDGGASLVPFDQAHATISEASHILISVPPGESGDPVLNKYRDELANHPGLAWLGYLSTTGVYGDTGGEMVDETAAINPTNPRSRRRRAAEIEWQRFADEAGLALHIFRLAGIYGPGRSAFDQIRGGTARRIDRPGFKFSRIHVEDAAAVLKASLSQPYSGAIYNLADDEAVEQQEVVAYACGLMGAPPPPLVPFSEAEPEMSEMARSFWNDNRQIDNARIKRELGITLAYPNYRAGLQAILAAESGA